MSRRDYYEILGVSRDASSAEIRRAYRRLARRCSPDVNLWDMRAAGRFDELQEAYRVLGDPVARARYDRLGHGAAGAGAAEGSGAARGEDIHYAIELELEEALRGVEAEIEVTRLEPCRACRASGGAGGRTASPCPVCQARPIRLALEDDRPVAVPCVACGGTGWRQPPPCAACGGRGTHPEPCRVRVTIPAGVDTGGQVRIPGEGHAGPAGGPRGDLLVITRVRPHRFFTRKGDHLHCEVPVTVPEAALGARIRVPTPDGPAMVTIPAGAQSGQVFRLRGRGCPRWDRDGRGDLLIQLRVVIPRNADPALEEVLQALRRLLPDNPRVALWGGPAVWATPAERTR